MTRRTLVLSMLVFTIAATALAATTGLFAGSPGRIEDRQGPFVLVAAGASGDSRFSLRFYYRDGELCRALLVTDQAASRCAPAPPPGAIGVTSAASARYLYVAGVAGGRVRSVSARVRGTAKRVATVSLSAAQQSALGFHETLRSFVVVLPLYSGQPETQVSLVALDSEGRRIGGVETTCAAEDAGASCH